MYLYRENMHNMIVNNSQVNDRLQPSRVWISETQLVVVCVTCVVVWYNVNMVDHKRLSPGG